MPRGGGGGGGGGVRVGLLNFGCQFFPKGPHDIHFLAEQLLKFSKGAFCIIITSFEGGARAGKRDFLVNVFKKYLKTPVFFQKFACVAENF